MNVKMAGNKKREKGRRRRGGERRVERAIED
jgi:hypothetical protein